jgi:hypothetical protein
VKPPRPKVIHLAGMMRDDGAVSAACSPKPRPIDLRRATWTIRRDAVTCPPVPRRPRSDEPRTRDEGPVMLGHVKKLVPDLAEMMRELKRYWDGDAASDRARAQCAAVLAVVDAVLGPEAVQPECCWGYDLKTKRCRCRLHRAIEDLRALTRRAPARRRRTTR